MRFSPFAVLSCLAALAVVDALPAVNLDPKPRDLVCCLHVSLTFRVIKRCMFTITTEPPRVVH